MKCSHLCSTWVSLPRCYRVTLPPWNMVWPPSRVSYLRTPDMLHAAVPQTLFDGVFGVFTLSSQYSAEQWRQLMGSSHVSFFVWQAFIEAVDILTDTCSCTKLFPVFSDSNNSRSARRRALPNAYSTLCCFPYRARTLEIGRGITHGNRVFPNTRWRAESVVVLLRVFLLFILHGSSAVIELGKHVNNNHNTIQARPFVDKMKDHL